MQIQSSAANPLDTPTAAHGKPAGQTAATLANQNTFLQLLVAQIKNQDPTQPADGTTFLTQLAQFSQLEQLISIRQELSSASAGNTPPAN